MTFYYYFCCCRQQTCCPDGVHNNKSSLYLFLNRNVCDLDRKLACYWPGVTGSCMCCQPIYLRFLRFEQGHNNTCQISLNHLTETEDFSCHAFSPDLSNFCLCIHVLLLFFPNVEICVYLQMHNYMNQHWG